MNFVNILMKSVFTLPPPLFCANWTHRSSHNFLIIGFSPFPSIITVYMVQKMIFFLQTNMSTLLKTLQSHKKRTCSTPTSTCTNYKRSFCLHKLIYTSVIDKNEKTLELDQRRVQTLEIASSRPIHLRG